MSELVTKIKDSVDVIHDIGCDYSNISNPPTIPDAYTKTETDALLATKVDSDEVYSKSVLNAILDSKADEDNVYDKSQTYSKTEVDSALALKADAADVYTKTESDAALALKANSADVYTISQTDGLLDAKASVDDSSTTATMATWSASKLNTEFQNCAKLDAQNEFTNNNIIVSDFSDPSTSIGKVLEFDDVTEPYSFGLYMSRPSDPSVDGFDANIELNGDGKVKVNSLSFEFTGAGEFDIPHADVTINGAKPVINASVNTAIPIGKIGNKVLYRKYYSIDNPTTGQVVDSNIKSTTVKIWSCSGYILRNDNTAYIFPWQYTTTDDQHLSLDTGGLKLSIAVPSYSIANISFHIDYTEL